MARKRKDSRTHDERMEDLLRCSKRTEVFRRLRGYCEKHLEARIAAGAADREIAHIRQDIQQITDMLNLDGIYPMDTPERGPEPPPIEQPLGPPGSEEWMADFLDGLLQQGELA